MSGSLTRAQALRKRQLLEESCRHTSLQKPQDAPSQPTQVSSNLLNKLPAEIRIMIWELALGGNTLHLSAIRDDQRLSRLQCRNHGPHRDLVWSTESGLDHWDPPEVDSRLIVSDRHGRRLQPRHGKYKISLLRTCRQIYNEARLIPYAQNMFTFENESVLSQFILFYIADDQASAINKLGLCVEFSIDQPRVRVNPQVWRRLSAMEFIALKINFKLEYYARPYFAGLPTTYDRDDLKEAIEEWLPHLEHISANALNLRICSQGINLTDPRSELERLWLRVHKTLCPRAIATRPIIDYVGDDPAYFPEYFDNHDSEDSDSQN